MAFVLDPPPETVQRRPGAGRFVLDPPPNRADEARVRLGQRLYGPSRAVTNAATAFLSEHLRGLPTPSQVLMPRLVPNPILDPYRGAYESMEREALAGLGGGLIGSPLHPAFWTGMASIFPAAAPAMIPATAALMAGEELTQPKPNPWIAGLLGAGGAVSAAWPHVAPLLRKTNTIPPPRPVGIRPTPPSASPYSYLIHAEPVSATEAAAAAREAAVPPPYGRGPLRSAAELAMARRGVVGRAYEPPELPAADVTTYRSAYGEEAFPRAVPPKVQYPPGRIPRTRTAEGGYIFIPEEEPAPRAAVQAGAIATLSPQSAERMQRLTQEIKQAAPVREQQEALYSQGRSEKLAKVLSVRERVGGEAGHYAELGQLKGELEKVAFEGVRSKFSQADVDAMMDDINAALTGFDPVNARTGLLKLLDGQVPTRSELDLLRQVFGPDVVNTALAKRGAMEQFGDLAMKVLNSPKEVAAGFGDMSGALRQAGFLARRFPVIWARSFAKMFRQYFDAKYFEASQEAIRRDPAYPLAQQAKLRLTIPGASYAKGEETFQSGLGQQIPGVRRVLGPGIRAANRAYSGILNNMAFEVFKRYVRLYKGNPVQLEGIANFLNNATLRGDLRIPFLSSARGGGPLASVNESLQRTAPILNAALWSPRSVSSRWSIYADPVYYLTLPKGVRIEAFKTLLAKSFADAAALGLASALGFKVGTDIRNADFLKIRVGNTRFDFNGGAQQNWVLMGRLLTGQMVNSVTGREFQFGEGYRATTALDIVQRYFGGKLSPVAALAVTALEGKQFGGKPINWPAAVLDMYLPMFLDDIYEVLDDQGQANALVALGGINSFFGGGTQTYGRTIPNIEKTAMGRPTVKFRPPPTLGERAINALTGARVSNISPALHRPLSNLNLRMKIHKADVDKAKALTAKDGGTRRVRDAWGDTTIWVKRGAVTSKTTRRQQTPAESVAASQRGGGR